MVVSPSIVLANAKITSFTEPPATRSTSESISRSPGPMPSIGEITPPRTWYSPRYCWVFSMAITSWMFSTTHTVVVSRWGSEHIGHSSVSLMLWQQRQYLISLRSLTEAWANRLTSSGDWRNRCSTRRRAVLRPMPGSRENSPTASSSSCEGYLLGMATVSRRTDKRRHPP